MDPVATFSGLASGIDFRTLVDQIIQLESRPIRSMEQRISEAEARATAWGQFRSRVEALQAQVKELADGSAFDQFITSVTTVGGTANPLSASASEQALPGSYQVRVLQLAAAEKLGSDVFSSRTAALGLSGEILVNGTAVTISASDSLDDVVAALNRVNTGADATGVTATILQTAAGSYRILLTSDAAGSEGIDLADVTGGVLRGLGFLDSTAEVRRPTSNGAESRGFLSSSTAVATLLGLTTPPSAGAVTIGTFQVTLDLATMSLDDIASAINTAAAGAGSAVTASVVQDTSTGGDGRFRLRISGTTSFTDANGILETLGVLEGGRAAVSQRVEAGNAFTAGDAVTPATAATLLTDLWVNGAAAGVQVGDTLTLDGTRGDGSTFSRTYTVASGDTLQTLLDALNDTAAGFKAGTRTATASIDAAGRLVVTDDQAGESRLALSIVAHNEGGGTLDFGTFSVAQAGRDREIVPGADAQVEVDGNFVTRKTNTLTDVIPGLTLRLLETSTSASTVEVSRNTGAVTTAVKDFVDAYNQIVDFVADQFSGAGAEEGVENRPLSGDGVLRHMASLLREAMQTQISAAVGGAYLRLADVGIEVDRDGRFQFTQSVLEDALRSDPAAVRRLFGAYGSGDSSLLEYVSSTSDTVAGTYAVQITQPAVAASVTGSGFGGTYVDDATPDTLTVQDLGSGATYSVSLSNGMTLAQIVDALNSEFATAKRHRVQATETFYQDAVGTAATDATLLSDLRRSDGTSYGVADGDTITISGTRADGTSFFREFTVTDVTTQTLGDLRAEIAAAVGSGEIVSVQGGQLTVEAQEDGSSALTLSVTSDNAGGGSLTFGTFQILTAGRSAARITASDSGGQLKLQHQEYGSGEGFQVSYTAGGTDGTASLGLAAGTYAGMDVAGTIGGQAATGTGRILVGAADTDVDGLMIRYEGADTGVVGNVTFSRGAASAISVMAEQLLGTGAGSIEAITEEIQPAIDRLNDRITLMEDRLERRREDLIRRFSALEEALALAQAQAQWLTTQFASIAPVQTP